MESEWNRAYVQTYALSHFDCDQNDFEALDAQTEDKMTPSTAARRFRTPSRHHRSSTRLSVSDEMVQLLNVSNLRILRAHSSVYLPYRAAYRGWYDAYVLVRRMALLALYIFVTGAASRLWQRMSIGLLLLAYAVFHIYCQPYFYASTNALQGLCFLSLLVSSVLL